MSNLSGAEFVLGEPEFVFPVQQHVADLFLREGHGGAACAGVEHGHALVEDFRNFRARLDVIVDREVFGGLGGGVCFRLAARGGEIVGPGLGEGAPQRQEGPAGAALTSWDWR